jgi:hypothetical protein
MCIKFSQLEAGLSRRVCIMSCSYLHRSMYHNMYLNMYHLPPPYAACFHRCTCCTRMLLGICGTTLKSLVRIGICGAHTCVSNSHKSRPRFRGAYASCRFHTSIAACITTCISTCITCRHRPCILCPSSWPLCPCLLCRPCGPCRE